MSLSGSQASDEVTLASTLAGDAPRSRREIEPGEVIGRYTVLEHVGSGGMGSVYAAFDPELDRRVAVKVLHDEERGEALLREAKTLASLSHPNVVVVFDAGAHEGRVWLAMEFVQGRTLSEWLEEEPRSWQEVLEVMLDAGQGLAAAHDAGIIHRDFKPANVMLSSDGRARVMDFGLAWTRDPSVTAQDRSEPPAPGKLLGTPAYMSPEQLWGRAVGPAADQFSFCVSFWVALFGRRPFAGNTVPQIVASVTAGTVRDPPLGRDVPAWLPALLRRGLETKVEARWPSLEHLLSALREHPTRRKRRIRNSVVLLAGGGVLIVSLLSAGGDAPCEGAREHIQGVWNPDRRAAVANAIDSLELPYGAISRDHVLLQLDAYADGWVAEHRDACLATAVHQQQSPALLDLRIDCLDQARGELDATIRVLAAADASVAERATELADALPDLSRCRDADALASRIDEIPEDVRKHVEIALARIDEAQVLLRAGKPLEVMEIVEALQQQRMHDVHPPLDAQIALLEGHALRRQSRPEDAARSFERALDAALSHGQDSFAAQAASTLAVVQAGDLEQPSAARMSMRVALAQAERTGSPTDRRAAHHAAAVVLAREGRFAEVEHHAEAIADLEASLGRESVDAHGLLARAFAGRGQRRQALEHAERAVTIVTKELGASHPTLAGHLEDQADALANLHRLGEAEEVLRRAVGIRQAVYGPGHPMVARSRALLGSILSNQELHDEAIEELQAALEVQLDTAGPEAAVTCVTRNNLALALQRADRLADAEEQLREVVRVREGRLDSEHPQLTTSQANLGLALLAQEKRQEAEPYFRQAAAGMRRRLGPDSFDTLRAESMLGQTLLGMGRHEQAEPLLQRVWDNRHRDGFAASAVHAAGLLAPCLWSSPGKQAQAERVALEALEIAKAKDLPPAATEMITDWLETHDNVPGTD